MTIRNIITAAAMVAVLGLAGGSAYADGHDDALVENAFIASADANYPGTVFVYEGDNAGHDGEILSTDGFEQTRLPQDIVESLLY